MVIILLIFLTMLKKRLLVLPTMHLPLRMIQYYNRLLNHGRHTSCFCCLMVDGTIAGARAIISGHTGAAATATDARQACCYYLIVNHCLPKLHIAMHCS